MQEDRRSMEDTKERDSRKPVLIVTTLSSFLTPLSLSTVNVALPTIGKSLAVDAITLSWIATTYLMTGAMFLVPFGRVADMFGRRRIFLYGMWFFTISSFFLGIAPSVNVLLIFRAFQGIGASMIFGTGVAILSSVYPPGERGRAIGINIAAVYMGLSCGPFFGGLLTQHFGWRSIFLFNVPLGIFVILLSIKKLKQEWADAKGESFDFVGSLIYSLTVLFAMYGFSHLPTAFGFVLIVSGMVGVPVFIRWESRTKHPVLDMGLFIKNRVFAFSNLAALLNYSATFAVGFLLSLYLQYLKGLSPQNTGFILVSQPIIQAVFSPLAGKLSDRLEPRLVASSGMALTSLGLVFFAFLDADTTLTLIVANLMFLGLSFAFFSSPNTNAIMSSVENKLYGVASSTLATMRVLGQMLSMGIATLIFALFIGRVKISPAYYETFIKSMRIAFVIFAVLSVLGVFASLSRGNLRQENIIDTGMDGVIISNTTISRPVLKSQLSGETGGLSGAPLTDLNTRMVKLTVQKLNGRLPVIASGGVMNAADAQTKLDAGAALVQLYSGLVYEGPGLVKEILNNGLIVRR